MIQYKLIQKTIFTSFGLITLRSLITIITFICISILFPLGFIDLVKSYNFKIIKFYNKTFIVIIFAVVLTFLMILNFLIPIN